ncbi:hypothetical protein AOZ07_01340 [Glutamicibacter halophytocola]|uniref:hypothetical protein n=1 Tax=Glutamicibacter halophytocola TaxID=1933880 RepID=UPI0006D4B69F|nr:hypothetical protein [Glutamicibacter halophytocola]ALG27772.1 hypothetical protein AOZ07_01340 [Glutamicibacter halophytocola]
MLFFDGEIFMDNPVAAHHTEAQQLLARRTDDKAPMIRILGTVDVLDTRGLMPVSPNTGNESPGIETCCISLPACFAMNPVATTEQCNVAFWPGIQPTVPIPSTRSPKLHGGMSPGAAGTMVAAFSRHEPGAGIMRVITYPV